MSHMGLSKNNVYPIPSTGFQALCAATPELLEQAGSKVKGCLTIGSGKFLINGGVHRKSSNIMDIFRWTHLNPLSKINLAI